MTNKITLILVTLCIIVSGFPVAVHAAVGDRVYVDDVIWITFREGNGSQFKSKAVIKSGTRLTILEEDKESGFSHVRREDSGDTGWVLSRYLSDTPIAADRIAPLEKKVADLEAERSRLQGEVRSLRKERKTSQNLQSSLDKELEEIKRISKDSIDLHNNNRELKLQFQAKQEELEKAVAEAEKASSRLLTFTVTAGIVCLLLGLYIGTTPIRRDKRWRSLP